MKVGLNSNLDMLKFKNLAKEREKAIDSSFIDPIKYEYKVNKLVEVFHPKKIRVVVDKIKQETIDTKTFILKSKDKEELPPFKAGQYIVLDVKLNQVVYKRPYSISSSIKDTTKYEITIKRVRNGLISNYMLNEVKEGMEFIIHGPFGEFNYQPLRDKENILALVGGSGITPIMSMARSIKDKALDCNLTILYGEKSEKELIFKKELDELNKNCDQISVNYVLSEEESNIYETGLIDKSLIMKYDIGAYSYFVCGPTMFYHHLNNIFKELDIPNKYIRHDFYKNEEPMLKHEEHYLTVITDDKEIKIPCYEDETLMEAMEKNGIEAQQKCLIGVCGFCRSKLINGKVKTDVDYVRVSDKNHNYIHPCVSYPLSDVTIKLCK